jgi:hypothetical protein
MTEDELWCKYCVDIYLNGKMRLTETILGMEGRGRDVGEWWRR